MSSTNDFPVDIVYLWCDSDDVNWKAKKNQELQKYNIPLDIDAIDKCRFVNNDELRYSLRSLEKYAPWINNIYIVTDNQIPDWLDVSNRKIHIIDHSQILPPEVLPTFNASAIETSIHKIQNLSEHFLFANDDMFFGNPVEKSFFYNENGLPIFRFSKRNIVNKKYKHLFGYMVSSAYKLVTKKIGKTFAHFSHHNIDAYRKSSIENCVNEFCEGFEKTTRQKFREKDCIQRSIFGFYAIAKNEGSARVTDGIFNKLKTIITHQPLESLQIVLKKNKLQLIEKYNPSLFCINDSQNTTDDDRFAMRAFLEKKFPNPSSFEKQSNKNADILVCYHKPFDKIENEFLKPIQVGAEFSDFDLEMLKDNDGNNISGKNKYYSELTALYWLWKNSSAEYKGLVHYRRFFDFSNSDVRWINKIPKDYTRRFCLNKSFLEHLLHNYDIILPMRRVISKYNSNYEQYLHKHVISDMDKVLEIIKEKYLQMYDVATYTMNLTKETYLYNMIITKKEIFDEYAKWLFEILFTLEKDIQKDVETRDDYQKRVYGFLSERLFTIYVNYLKFQGMRELELPVIYCETNPKRFRIFKFRKAIYKILVKFGIRRPHWNEQYGV